MPHDHSHHIDREAGDRRVLLAVLVNVGLTVAQIVAGVISGSLALIADAVHNLSDAISLGIAFGARKIARRPSDRSMTFGYGRAEVVAALINYTTLIVIGVYLVSEALWRLADPPGVTGWIVVVVAALALAVDTVTALLTWRMSKESMNIRAAFLHNLSDALASVAVIVAGTLIILYDWRLIDPLVTIGIAGYILWLSVAGIRPVIRVLMLGSPPDMDLEEVYASLQAVPGVVDLHHLHLWQMQEHVTSLDAHVVVRCEGLSEADAIRQRIREMLKDQFGITHSSLELEREEDACADPPRIGHGDET